MPESGPQDLSYINEVKRIYSESGVGYISDKKLAELARKYDQELIGQGAEAVVVGLTGASDQEKVAAFVYEDLNPREAKETFYLHRIFSTLFPHNFPHFSASSTLGTVRRKIVAGQFRSPQRKVKSSANMALAKFPFKKVEKVCRELGINLYIDSSNHNFIVGSDGGEYYVDTVIPSDVVDWDSDNIIKYMKSKKYSQNDMEIVRLSIERLKTLQVV